MLKIPEENLKKKKLVRPLYVARENVWGRDPQFENNLYSSECFKTKFRYQTNTSGKIMV
jgi:hypothetical protein